MGLSTTTTSFLTDTSPHPITLSSLISQLVFSELQKFLLRDLHKSLPSSLLSNLHGCLLPSMMETTVLVTLVLILLTQKKRLVSSMLNLTTDVLLCWVLLVIW